MFKNTRQIIGRHRWTALSCSGILLFLLFCIAAFALAYQMPFSLSFFPRWNLTEIQSYFTGPIPEGAIDIHYQSGDSYGQLSFKAPPASAMEFVNRFCTRFLYQGYDPFNASDDGTAENGHLIQTQANYFYYSYSVGTPSTYYGSRCYGSSREPYEPYQILVDKTNVDQYIVRLEISPRCDNPLAPHRCDGFPVQYSDHGVLSINGPSQTFRGHFASGDRWGLAVKPGARYQITVTSLGLTTGLPSGSPLRLTTIAYAADTYCAECWLDVLGATTASGFTATFVGSPSGKTLIDLFWFSEPGLSKVEVHEIKN